MGLIIFHSEVMEELGLSMWASAKLLQDYYDQIVYNSELFPEGAERNKCLMEMSLLEEMGHGILFGI